MYLFRLWYNSGENQGTLLADWKYMTLRRAMEEKAGDSEAAIYHNYVARMRSFKNESSLRP